MGNKFKICLFLIIVYMIFSTYLYANITNTNITQISSNYNSSLFEDMIDKGMSYEEAIEKQNEKIYNKNNLIILSTLTFATSCVFLFSLIPSKKIIDNTENKR